MRQSQECHLIFHAVSVFPSRFEPVHVALLVFFCSLISRSYLFKVLIVSRQSNDVKIEIRKNIFQPILFPRDTPLLFLISLFHLNPPVPLLLNPETSYFSLNGSDGFFQRLRLAVLAAEGMFVGRITLTAPRGMWTLGVSVTTPLLSGSEPADKGVIAQTPQASPRAGV